MKRVGLAVLLAGGLACAAPPPADLGVSGGRLAPCPASPNCVSSDAEDESHRTEPFELASADPATAAATWAAVREAVADLPGTTIVEDRDGYLRAESRTPLMGFVDDLELHWRPGAGTIAVRSASRVGWSDMGTNRERVWALRRDLERRGVVR